MKETKVFKIFSACVEAIRKGTLINQVSMTDKEFHFQNWFENRLDVANIHFDKKGRNSYPDFVLVKYTEGYEIKGLAWPGRIASFDSNSQTPTGYHNGRDIYYVFGRYPKADKASKEYPVIDLVICHGDFLNADHVYVHKNKSVKGFGSYGDILIRDRKMYVAPTPFALADGLTGMCTLVTPAALNPPQGFRKVGNLVRVETDKFLVAYEFDLKANRIAEKTIDNPDSGKQHHFAAYRVETDSDKQVILAAIPKRDILEEEDLDEGND